MSKRDPEGLPMRPPRRPQLGDPLTPTERRVIELVRKAWENREIAAELVVSIKTVDAHLNHLKTKTGARNRVALALWRDNREAFLDGEAGLG